jgi:hypothetical protein
LHAISETKIQYNNFTGTHVCTKIVQEGANFSVGKSAILKRETGNSIRV